MEHMEELFDRDALDFALSLVDEGVITDDQLLAFVLKCMDTEGED